MTATKQLIRRIVSGGQTGVDRAALDVAIAMEIEHGGWCPRGRRAEDGRISTDYNLVETTSQEYRVRTEQNVLDADATLIFYREKLQGGTLLTYRLCEQHQKPFLLVDLTETDTLTTTAKWLESLRPDVLNVAGPRDSTAPGIYAETREYLIALLSAEVD